MEKMDENGPTQTLNTEYLDLEVGIVNAVSAKRSFIICCSYFPQNFSAQTRKLFAHVRKPVRKSNTKRPFHNQHFPHPRYLLSLTVMVITNLKGMHSVKLCK